MGTPINNSRLRELLAARAALKPPRRTFQTGLPALDALLPDGALPRGAVHEIIQGDDTVPPLLFTLLLARAALKDAPGSVVWSDPEQTLYPPAVAQHGLPLRRLLLLRGINPADEVWALTQSLRCKGVAAAVASPQRLSPVEARRLQLAAEQGGSVGLLVRRRGAAAHYAAATRWLVTPTPGDAYVQRWRVQLIHGHGRLLTPEQSTIVLEVCRGTNHVRASDQLVDRPSLAPTTARATA